MIDEVDLAFASGAVSTSDLIYLAMPVGEIIGFLGERGRQIKPGAVVTDAGSTKVEVCRAARSYLTSDWHFIGGIRWRAVISEVCLMLAPIYLAVLRTYWSGTKTHGDPEPLLYRKRLTCSGRA